MRLVTIVRLTKDGVTGESVTAGEVSEGYSEEQFAKRMIKQFRKSKQELTAGLTARRAQSQTCRFPCSRSCSHGQENQTS